ncbi:unnamed protein product [Thlaspi arvense]|uniref:Replication protein A 70 kDa DNA-binding subunit B/D first OB fold domain-containing protein n=1 Tax=Thlaspi arvense TaxID=13288 RepID=A0AAU9SJT8_THLAR|nr:unnamed protein product [Thlaspi arvense]
MASTALRRSGRPSTFQILNNNQGDFCNEEVLARLVHFWEARNFKKCNILMGVELLLLDSESNAVQGFISANRLFRHEENLKRNSVYKLKKFLINPCKKIYKVSDHNKTICFTDHTTMVEVTEGDHEIETQKFRLRTFNDFSAIANMETDLFDAIGQIRLISGDNLRPTNEDATQVIGDRSKDRVFLHLRAVTLSSTSATRLFFDRDIAETKEFMTLYRFEISVRDANNDTATFVLFDPNAMKLAGRSANDVLNDTIEYDNVDLNSTSTEESLNVEDNEGKLEVTGEEGITNTEFISDELVFNGENETKRPRH